MKKYFKELMSILAVVAALLLTVFIGLAQMGGSSGSVLRKGSSLIVMQEAGDGEHRIVCLTPGMEKSAQGTVLKADLARDVFRRGKKVERHPLNVTLRLRLTLPTYQLFSNGETQAVPPTE